MLGIVRELRAFEGDTTVFLCTVILFPCIHNLRSTRCYTVEPKRNSNKMLLCALSLQPWLCPLFQARVCTQQHTHHS